jgi:hypothetical protein
MAENQNSVDQIQNTSSLPLPLVVRSYFQDIVNDDGDNIEAVCSLCKPKKNVIKGQYKAPSNFTKHIQV